MDGNALTIKTNNDSFYRKFFPDHVFLSAGNVHKICLGTRNEIVSVFLDFDEFVVPALVNLMLTGQSLTLHLNGEKIYRVLHCVHARVSAKSDDHYSAWLRSEEGTILHLIDSDGFVDIGD